jgi:hypothetical protein
MTHEPKPFDILTVGFWLVFAVIFSGAVYVGGLAQYAHMLVDPK